MNDTCRAAERRFRETRALADEVAWIRERLRAGQLTAARLDVAALAGHAAAARFLDRDCNSQAFCVRCFQEPSLVGAFETRGGAAARLRAAIAAARAFVASCSWRAVRAPAPARPAPGTWPDLAPAMETTIAWVERHVLDLPPLPEEERARACEALAPYWPWYRPPACFPERERAHAHFDPRPALLPLAALLQRGEPDWGCLQHVRTLPPVLVTIGDELATWALGYGDPVRARVEAGASPAS